MIDLLFHLWFIAALAVIPVAFFAPFEAFARNPFTSVPSVNSCLKQL